MVNNENYRIDDIKLKTRRCDGIN